MALVSAAQAARIRLAYPQHASVAAQCVVGDLKTETLVLPVPTTVVRKHRKVILPSKQVLTIDE
jgi:hypothetical protein